MDIARRRVGALEADGAVHLGGVEHPVREPDERDRRVDHHRVQHLERRVGRVLGEAHFVEQEHNRRVLGVLLVAHGHLVLVLDRARRRERRALVRHDADGREARPELAARLRAEQVRRDHLERERLRRAGLADAEDRDAVEDADGRDEEVLGQRVVHRDAVVAHEPQRPLLLHAGHDGLEAPAREEALVPQLLAQLLVVGEAPLARLDEHVSK